MSRFRARLHNALRAHYWFTQGDDHFFICAPRVRWCQRPTEYTIALRAVHGLPVVVTRERFVDPYGRFSAEAVATLDEAIALLEADPETDDRTEEDEP